MATARTIINRALRAINVSAISETPSADEANAGLDALNDLLASWANEKVMTYQLVQRTKALTAGTQTYTIGSGGDIDTTRPLKIDNAFTRDSSNNDTYIEVIDNSQWSRIGLKDAGQAYPIYLYYRPNYPLGQINLYPPPSSGLTLYLEVWDQFSSISTLDTSISLPPGYDRLIKYALAIELATEYHPSARIMANVREAYRMAKEYIMDVNNVVPQMRIDTVGNRRFNIRAGEYYN